MSVMIALVAVLVAAVVARAVVGFVFVCVGSDPRKRADYAEVVEKILAGELVPDRRGTIILPPELASAGRAWASKTREVFVTKSKDGSLYILFPTFIGKGRDMGGYVYCDPPKQDLNVGGILRLRLWRVAPYMPEEPYELDDDLLPAVKIRTKIDNRWYRVGFTE